MNRFNGFSGSEPQTVETVPRICPPITVTYLKIGVNEK